MGHHFRKMVMKNKQDSIDDHTQSLNHKELNLVPVSHLAGYLDIIIDVLLQEL